MLVFFAMGALALLAGCTDSPEGDLITLSPTEGVATTTTAPRQMPTVLTSLPQEGEADSYPAPDLLGFLGEDVLVWAEASGLTQVNIFEDESEIVTESEFNPQRLTLVVQNEIVVYAEFG